MDKHPSPQPLHSLVRRRALAGPSHFAVAVTLAKTIRPVHLFKVPRGPERPS